MKPFTYWLVLLGLWIAAMFLLFGCAESDTSRALREAGYRHVCVRQDLFFIPVYVGNIWVMQWLPMCTDYEWECRQDVCTWPL